MIYHPEEAELSPTPRRDLRAWVGPILIVAGVLLAAVALLIADGRL